ISAVATGTPRPLPGDADDEPGEDAAETVPGIELTLAPLPPLTRRDAGPEPGLTRREEKRRLREANAALARELVRRSGADHAHVNAELNRLAGIRRVAEATVEQLERRLEAADRWLART